MRARRRNNSRASSSRIPSCAATSRTRGGWNSARFMTGQISSDKRSSFSVDRAAWPGSSSQARPAERPRHVPWSREPIGKTKVDRDTPRFFRRQPTGVDSGERSDQGGLAMIDVAGSADGHATSRGSGSRSPSIDTAGGSAPRAGRAPTADIHADEKFRRDISAAWALLGRGAKKRSDVRVFLVNMAKSDHQRRKPGTKIMITAAQCRSARTLLSWSVNKLAIAASVAETTIHDFELERHRPDMPTLDAIQRAFEEVGIVFLAGDDVQLRSAVAPSK
jgi:hypothetical protein